MALDETDYLNTFLVRTTTTRTLLERTLIVTLISTLRPTSTLALLRQRLYCASETPLKLSHVHYNLTIYMLRTNRLPLYDDCLLMSREKTRRITGREQYTRSNAATARLLTLVKLAETLARNWPNTNEQRENGDVNNHIAEHHLQTKHQIDSGDSATYIKYSTDYYQRLTLESWFTNLEQTPLNRSQQLPAPYKRLINGIKQNY